jgi:hypothetical protein
MTFIIKKYEESRREYEKLLSKFLHEVDKTYSYKSKQILPYDEKYPFHNSPTFNYSLKKHEARLTIDEVKKRIESKKKFENYSLVLETNKKQLEKAKESNYQYSTYLIRISIFTIVYVLIISLVIPSLVFLYPVTNSDKWAVVLSSFVALYQMVYTIYQNWIGTNANVRLIDNNLFDLQNIINDLEEYKKKNNIYIPSPLESQ